MLSVLVGQATLSLSSDATAQTPTAIEYRALLDQYCVTCHNQSVVDDPNAPANALLSQLRAVGALGSYTTGWL
jgi:cytochrome c5